VLENGDYEQPREDQRLLYSRDVMAVVGGRHVRWLNNDWEELRAETLVLWTSDSAEPGLELFFDNGKFKVLESTARYWRSVDADR
jgi:hypothetical protein